MKAFALSPKALADLEDIHDYIARDNAARAKSFTQELLQICERLPQNAEAYPARSQLGDGIRVAILGSYMIFFRNLPEEVRVERIIHGARDLVRQFKM